MTIPLNPYSRAGATALTYRDVRPGYPTTLLSRFFDGDAPSCVVDIGAGTGKLTSQLVDLSGSDTDVIAIEPSADMRSQLIEILPDSTRRVLDTSGEDTRLPASSCDVVFYAQSWHWVDPDAASDEAARILCPGGQLVLLFNQMDVSIPWVKRLSRIMRSGDIHKPTKGPVVGEHFSKPTLSVTFWQDYLTPAQVCQLGTTRSSWITSTPQNQEKMQANVRWYLYEKLGYHEDHVVEIPYITYMWVAERKQM
ncbi:Methyltransferase domain-containing protein [Arcanobacterium phocae]|uniref:Methyltransferase domain-containing protein n=1 Tax=Arcanobacterium phocae TaxID=131112 RepID=A0A1H2LPH1_9ACTO|nr:class I SAM-dependent methyltransferase [Arcanobacterium phocae]SDU82754.1 Methyltransferase domain-containing protein [Arcanobacterium phocae]